MLNLVFISINIGFKYFDFLTLYDVKYKNKI